ncbi:MAG: aspartate--tRNA ligase [Candidatus Marinimicrobia bacterium]|nr:aspartate--tRNA ligase [Candidatus Neomarinimicrobiota bacterium]
MLKRTHTCGELRPKDSGKEVILCGWVNTTRDHGGLIFIDLRDRYGITQIVFDQSACGDFYEKAKKLGFEDVIGIKGIVRKRPEESINESLATGEIEVLVKELEIFNESKPLPFMVTDRSSGLENLRLKYRYLDLRTREMQRNIYLRHKAAQTVREYYNSQGFYEIETPFLMKSTPEGARDFLVPSRIHRGKFYALPQSPQMFKQILMIAGFDKYYQIVRCFRDEDLRADRQPEFTQIDVEMSFVDENDVMTSTEEMLRKVFKNTIGVELEEKFPVLTYDEAIKRYGSDSPDIRFGLELKDVSKVFLESDFNIFKKAVADGGFVAGLCSPAMDYLTRMEIDRLTEQVKNWGGKGLAWVRITEKGFEGGISKFVEGIKEKLIDIFAAKPGNVMFFIADKDYRAFELLGMLRSRLGENLNLIKTDSFKCIWVTNFPLLEWDEEEQRYKAMHHPFTAPVAEDIELLETEPTRVRSRAYDIVINGVEIGGGSIRNHRVDIQKKLFKVLGISEKEAERKFGFLLEALSYGAPPHGGIALGFDRLIMLLAGEESIREVIAFPKTKNALSLMDGSPSEVSEEQLKELGIKITKY